MKVDNIVFVIHSLSVHGILKVYVQMIFCLPWHGLVWSFFCLVVRVLHTFMWTIHFFFSPPSHYSYTYNICFHNSSIEKRGREQANNFWGEHRGKCDDFNEWLSFWIQNNIAIIPEKRVVIHIIFDTMNNNNEIIFVHIVIIIISSPFSKNVFTAQKKESSKGKSSFLYYRKLRTHSPNILCIIDGNGLAYWNQYKRRVFSLSS